jgi:hypothetical protein
VADPLALLRTPPHLHRKELEKKHQKAGRAKDSELLAAFAAAAKEQVEMALTLARCVPMAASSCL